MLFIQHRSGLSDGKQVFVFIKIGEYIIMGVRKIDNKNTFEKREINLKLLKEMENQSISLFYILAPYSIIPAGYRSPFGRIGVSDSAFSILTSLRSPGFSLIVPTDVFA